MSGYGDAMGGIVRAEKAAARRHRAARRLLNECIIAGLPAPHVPAGDVIRFLWDGYSVAVKGHGLFDLGDRHGFAARGVGLDEAMAWLKERLA